MTKKTMTCPHCGAECAVWRNGNRCCPECGKTFRVDCFDIRPVKQPDDISCGWATTLWLLRSFAEIGHGAAAAQELREELNTDVKRGLRGRVNQFADMLNSLTGLNIPHMSGTWPLAIYSALSQRGLTLKNPIRLESPAEYEAYLHETMNEGGRGIVLLWGLGISPHWMGADRKDGVLRIMDPAVGAYLPFDTALANWKNHNVNFLVFGIVRK